MFEFEDEEEDALADFRIRKNMFVSQNEREHFIHQCRMKESGWHRSQQPQLPIFLFGEENDEALIPPINETLPPVLRNTDILENIAMSLPSQDMVNCRLVCRQWAIEMGFFLFRRKSLIVAEEDCPSANRLLKKRLREGDPVTLSKLSLFNLAPKTDLFQNLFSVFGPTLSNLSLEDCSLTPKDLHGILVNFSPNLRYLHFREDGKCSKESKKSVFKEIKRLTKDLLIAPHLKFLYWDEGSGQTDLKELIGAFPNLVTLELRNFLVPRPSSFKNLSWDKLTRLFLSPKDSLTDHHCKALSQLKLKLNKLTLFGVNSREQSSIKGLHKFLLTLADTLEVLELWLDYPSVVGRRENEIENLFSPFPISLPHLKQLRTEIEVIGHLNNLGQQLTSLSELEITSNTFEEDHQKWEKFTKRTTIKDCSHLTSFRCGDINNKSLSKVIMTFPNIQELYVFSTHVNDAFLRTVIKSLPRLTGLTITPCMRNGNNTLNLSDSGITGVSKEICRKANRIPINFIEFDVSTVKTQVGLSDLKELTKLDISLHECDIGDASILLGISRLEKLSTLKLPNCKITDVSLRVIDERLTFLNNLGITGCENISQETLESLRILQTNILVLERGGRRLFT